MFLFQGGPSFRSRVPVAATSVVAPGAHHACFNLFSIFHWSMGCSLDVMRCRWKMFRMVAHNYELQLIYESFVPKTNPENLESISIGSDTISSFRCLSLCA